METVRRCILFLVLCSSALADMSGCEDWVKAFAHLPDPEKGLLYLSPSSERFLLGAQIRTKSNRVLIGVAGYSSRHSVIGAAFEHVRETGEIEDYSYEWLGESRWINPRDVAAQGTLVQANELASYWIEKVLPEEGGKNSVDRFFRRLRKHDKEAAEKAPKRIRLLSPSRLKMSFERSQITNTYHLLPGLDEFISVLEQLKTMDRIHPDETYRHFILSKFASLFASIDSVLENISGEYNTESEKLAALHSRFQYELGRESVQMLLRWLRNDGVQNSTIESLSEMMLTLMVRPLSMVEWLRLKEIKEDFNDFLSEYNTQEVQVGRVEIYELKN